MPKIVKKRTAKQQYQHDWYLKNKARQRRLNAAWRKQNQERIAQSRTKWRKRNPDKIRAQVLRYWHGMTLEDYDVLFKAQKGLCALCGKAPTEKWFCVDHCHRTHAVRGLVHRRCNILIGQLDAHQGPLNMVFAYMRNGGHRHRRKIKAKSRAHTKRQNWKTRRTFRSRR